MRLTFHIVVTPGSVQLAACAVHSLLRWSPWRYELVGNGLGPGEARELSALATSDPRLSCRFIPEHLVLPHGIVLNRLFDGCTEPYFAFADVDLFACGPIAEPLERAVQRAAVVTAGYHLALDPTEFRAGYEGKRLFGPRGEVLGVTFFAVYRSDAVRAIRQRYKVGFERYDYPEAVPVEARRRVEAAGYVGSAFDTAKLLNILLRLDGERLEHIELPTLKHVGGLAGALLPPGGTRARLVRKWSIRLRGAALTDRSLQPPWWRGWLWRARGADYYRDRAGTYRREQVAAYFARYFRALLSDHEPPPVELADEELRHRVNQMCQILRDALQQVPRAA